VTVKAQEELRQWAKASGLKLGWIAAQLPASATVFSRWLNGNKAPTAVYRERLADITGLENLRDEANWK
jgi:hypothetical protein